MIILDTNVISELMKDEPEPVVDRWVNRYPITTLFVTSVTEAEVLYGIAIKPLGRRRNSFEEAYRRLFDGLFNDRVLSFDRSAAREFSEIAARRRSKGLEGGALDVQIAAIAKVHGASVGTRNVSHFLEAGIEIINPWNTEITRT